MLKNINQKLKLNEEHYSLIGIVSTCKEYKLAWILNNILDISLAKENDEKINLINNELIYVSHFLYKRKKMYLRLISNKTTKSHLITSLSNFDYLVQFSPNLFEFSSFDIINKLKSNNLIQFANFVDTKLIKEKYLLYI
ncbi:MAG: IPExxxVDY family protein [Cytophagales bacterium]|nr:MAG: hypothetical protein CND58_00385 [Rhodothermaeota bacterium MED-G16]